MSENEKKNTSAIEIDLNTKGTALQLAKQIKSDIDEYCEKKFDDGFRWHLGASLIGHECKRYLFYVFRWCFKENFDGRMQRLFNRGHREEERFIEWLEGIGFTVYADDWSNWKLIVDDNDNYEVVSSLESEDKLKHLKWTDVTNNETHKKIAKAMGVKFKQYRIAEVNGHFGGSLDGIAIAPERYGLKEPLLLEFKTNGTGAGYTKLVNSGIQLAKPVHFSQMSTYGTNPAYGFKYGLYLNTNKNDDDIHVEIVFLNEELGKQNIVKAEKIIFSETPPPKLSENPTFHKCQYCAAKDICHTGALVNRNCRSCKFSKPVENAEFYCTIHNGIIPRDYIMTTCDKYSSINDD
jgi:hypothetical protein